MDKSLLWIVDVVLIAASLAGMAGLALREAAGRTIPSGARLALFAASAVMLLLVSRFGDPPLLFADFRIAYYPAGAAVLDHPASLAPFIQRGVTGFVNLPVLAYVFAPFGMLSLPVAAVLFTLLGLAAIVVTYLLLVRLTGVTGLRRLALLFLIAANGPLNYSVKEGNTSHFVLLGLVVSLWLLRRQWRVAAGVLLAVLALIKLPLLLFGPYLLYRRNGPAVLAFGFVCLGAAALSLAMFGWDLHVLWFDVAVRQFSDHTLSAFNVQSIQSFLARLADPAPPLFDWSLRELAPQQRRIGLLLTLLLYLITFLACVKASRSRIAVEASDNARQDLEFTLVLCLALVSSPLSWTHYYCWLLLPMALALGPKRFLASSPLATFLCWIGTLMVMPMIVPLQFSDTGVMAFTTKFVVSFYLLGGLIWFAVLAWSLARLRANRPAGEMATDQGTITIGPASTLYTIAR